MDPNNSQTNTGDESLQKLEGDLQKLSQDAPVQTATPQVSENITPISTPAPTIPDQEPVQPPQGPKSGSPIVTIAVVLGAVAIIAIIAYVAGTMFTNKAVTPKACTAEARVCPDGTSVGRSGPDCEFEACPTSAPIPTETPLESTTSMATPTGTPKSTSTPTSSPSASPTGY